MLMRRSGAGRLIGVAVVGLSTLILSACGEDLVVDPGAMASTTVPPVADAEVDTGDVEVVEDAEPDVVRDGDYVLVWSDEFEGSAGTPLNAEFWNYEVGGEGWGNQELQLYRDDPSVASLDGEGNLRIVADRLAEDDPLADPASGACWYGACEYTSARVTTQEKVVTTYGRIEGRIKIPTGQGIWPAFWMLGSNITIRPWPVSGEIDIMENIGSEPKTLHGSMHGPGYSGGEPLGGSITLAPGNLSDDFRVFAVEWTPEGVTWTVDGRAYASASPEDIADDRTAYWVFDKDFFLILNVAVGGQWPGSPDASTQFPQEMLVDWVRIWQLDA